MIQGVWVFVEPWGKGPCTKYLRFLILKTMRRMALGSRNLNYWVLAPFGLTLWKCHGSSERLLTGPEGSFLLGRPLELLEQNMDIGRMGVLVRCGAVSTMIMSCNLII